MKHGLHHRGSQGARSIEYGNGCTVGSPDRTEPGVTSVARIELSGAVRSRMHAPHGAGTNGKELGCALGWWPRRAATAFSHGWRFDIVRRRAAPTFSSAGIPTRLLWARLVQQNPIPSTKALFHLSRGRTSQAVVPPDIAPAPPQRFRDRSFSPEPVPFCVPY